VIQTGRGLGLITKAKQDLAVGSLLLREDLDGHGPGEGRIVGTKDEPHPPSADVLQ
jgi:hypothetical protein